jgi:hypothetical protein
VEGAFQFAIEWPARLVAGLIGGFFPLVIGIGGLATGVWIYRLADENLLMNTDERPRKWIVWTLAILAGVWVAMILGRSQHWLAFELLEAGRYD